MKWTKEQVEDALRTRERDLLARKRSLEMYRLSSNAEIRNAVPALEKDEERMEIIVDALRIMLEMVGCDND